MATDALLTEIAMPVGKLAKWLRLQFRASSWKQPVLVATTGNITLSGLQTIDGVTIPAKARVLVKNQTSAFNNAIYVAMHGAWLRALDADHVDKLLGGSKITVQSGTVNGGTTWRLSTTGTIVLGTTNLTFVNDSAPPAFTTGSRPSAVTWGVGAAYYDTTLTKPGYSDGTNWRDAAGTII